MAILSTAMLMMVVAFPITGTSGADGVEESFRIDTSTAQPKKMFEAFDTGAVAAFDLDGDGVKEIIVHNDNNNVYVFNGKTGSIVAELETNHPSGWSTRELGGIAVGDVNGNGRVDLVVTNSAGWVTAFETRPGPQGGMTFEKMWERHIDPEEEDPDYLDNNPWVSPTGNPGLDGSPYLADGSGDGKDEIFFQLDDIPSQYALNGDGSTRWWYDWSDGNANPIATDISGDGRIETVYPSDGGRLFVFDADTGQFRCSFNARDHGPTPASMSVPPTAADLLGDGRKELVFGVRNAVEDKDDPQWHEKQHAHYFAVDADCEVVWHKTWEWGNPHIYMDPVPVDVTGNGELDVVFQDWNTVGHKPGNWQSTGNPNLFAVKGSTGELIWQVETDGFWSNSNVALADVTGDGQQELLVVDSQAGRHGVSLFGLDGQKKGFFAAPSGWQANGGASVVDLEGDGGLEIVLPVMRDASGCTRDLDVGCREGALQVYRTQGSSEPIWSNVKFYNDAYDGKGVGPGSKVDLGTPVKTEDEAPTGEDEPVSGSQPDDDATTFGEDDTQRENRNEEDPSQDQDDSDRETENETPTGSGEPSGDASASSSSEGAEEHDESDPTPSRASGGGGGGLGAPEPPEIRFDEGFPAEGEPHDPMGPLVVHVSARSSVASVEMELDERVLEVEFDGETATHTPETPLPLGEHTFVVTATSEEGVPASDGRTLLVQEAQEEGAPATPEEETTGSEDEGGDRPAFPEAVGGDEEAGGENQDGDGDREERGSPLSLLVALVALGAVLSVAARRRHAE